MTQLSRPFQIALAATVLFAVVWFVALAPHGQSSSSTPVTSTPVSAPSQAAASQGSAAASSTKVYHGAAPGVEGLTRDIKRAHGAVAASQRAANTAASSAAQASSKGAVTSSSTTVTHSGAPGGNTATVSKSTSVTKVQHGAARTSTVTVSKSAKPANTPASTKSNGIPLHQAAVESELKRGEVVVVLFWNPKGADDVAVHEALQTLLFAHHEVRKAGNKKLLREFLKLTELELNKKIAVHYASANQVASFGSFTKTVQIYATPTTLIINKHGVVSTLNGLTDAFSIEQSIVEARHA